jgi:hypothetical protein
MNAKQDGGIADVIQWTAKRTLFFVRKRLRKLNGLEVTR